MRQLFQTTTHADAPTAFRQFFDLLLEIRKRSFRPDDALALEDESKKLACIRVHDFALQTHTYGSLSEVDVEEVVSGYHIPYDADLREIDYINPGGSMIATAQEVGVFLRALHDGSLLNDDAQATYSSIYEYEHTGWLPGYQGIARYHKDIDTVVIQFVNTTGGNRS